METDAGVRSIRSGQVITADGKVERSSWVYCPFHARRTPLDECADCIFCEETFIDPNERHSFIVCTRRAESSSARAHGPEIGAAVRGLPSAADHTPVTAAMTEEVVCLRPEVSMAAVARLFLDRHIGGAPIVDADGKPLGVITKTDLLRHFLDDDESEEVVALRVRLRDGVQAPLGRGFHPTRVAGFTAGEVMTPTPLTLSEKATIAQAAALMAYEVVHRLLILSAEGNVVGLVSALDVLRWVAQHEGYLVSDSPTPRR
jgi:CBS domain-containing protein